MKNETGDKRDLLTIGAFRREFFAPKSRPSFRAVERWIERGTTEGIVLNAYKLDDSYFINRDDALTFINASRVANKIASTRAKMNAEAALQRLRDLGVRC